MKMTNSKITKCKVGCGDAWIDRKGPTDVV